MDGELQAWFEAQARGFAWQVAGRLEDLAHANRCRTSQIAIIGPGMADAMEAKYPDQYREAVERKWIAVRR